MYRTSLVALLLTVVTFDVRAVSPSGHFQERLVELQRAGSCRDLPELGVNTHRRRNPDEVNVRLISEVGAQIVRLDMPWSDLERNGAYDFDPVDNLIGRLRENRKSIILALVYGHLDHSDGPAANGFPLPPRTGEQRTAYSKYAQAVAKRYHGPDIVYEIWNEPNLSLFWPPVPDVHAYGELLGQAASAIRDVDPRARIISGGLANENDPPAYLHALADAGALRNVDGIAFHPYRRDGPENSLYDIAEFESSVIGRGDRPLWLNEWGYSESWFAKTAPGHGRERVSAMTARLLLTAALAKAKAVLQYDLIDDGADANDQEANFGLYDYDFKPKPAAAAFRTISGLMSRCDKYEFKIDAAESLITAVFRSEGAVSYVVWTYATGRARDICFATANTRPIELKTISGDNLPLGSCGMLSQIKLKLSDESGPVILRAQSTSSK